MDQKVAVILAEGFEEIEAITPIDVLRRVGFEVMVAGLSGRTVTGSHDIPITADCLFADLNPAELAAVVLPGGMPGATNLRDDERVIELVKAMAAMEKVAVQHNIRIPVIAAGGVYDGADIKRFLDMGASGVQMGTRFVATHECDADEAFKQSYVDARKEDLTVIKSPVGLPGRALNNSFLSDVAAGIRRPFRCPYHCIKSCDPENSPYCIGLALAQARRGRLKNSFAFAGSNAFRVDKIVSVKEMMDSLASGYELATA